VLRDHLYLLKLLGLMRQEGPRAGLQRRLLHSRLGPQRKDMLELSTQMDTSTKTHQAIVVDIHLLLTILKL